MYQIYKTIIIQISYSFTFLHIICTHCGISIFPSFFCFYSVERILYVSYVSKIMTSVDQFLRSELVIAEVIVLCKLYTLQYLYRNRNCCGSYYISKENEFYVLSLIFVLNFQTISLAPTSRLRGKRWGEGVLEGGGPEMVGISAEFVVLYCLSQISWDDCQLKNVFSVRDFGSFWEGKRECFGEMGNLDLWKIEKSNTVVS